MICKEWNYPNPYSYLRMKMYKILVNKVKISKVALKKKNKNLYHIYKRKNKV